MANKTTPDMVDLFNLGGTTSTNVDRQTRDEFVTKAIVEMPKRKIVFGKLSNRIAMPKNHGDVLTKEITYPMLDSRNLIDGNVDANTALLLQDIWYHVNAAGELLGTYDTQNYLKGALGVHADARIAARAAAEAAVAGGAADDKLKSSAGGMVNGMASYSASQETLMPLPEEGGVINLLSATSKHVSAKISFHATGHKFSMRSIDLASRPATVGTKIKQVGEAVTDTKERQLRLDLLSQGSINPMICADMDNCNATIVDEITGMNTLSYEALTSFEQELLRDDVPMQTEMLTGIDLVDTVTVNDGWILYVNNEVLPTLRNLRGPDGTIAWQPVRQYAADKMTLDGEQGAIGSFRFITVKDMEVERGAGVAVGDATDDAISNAATQAGAFSTLDAADGITKYYDVFTALLVGDDSFSITGFGSNSTSASYIEPSRDLYNDMHKQMAGIAADWSYGFLCYRPERIKTLKFSVQRLGNAPVAVAV